jgi:hypothetical protein
VKEYKNPVCRGCWTLGNNCGTCERCIETRPTPKPITAAEVTQAAIDYTEKNIHHRTDVHPLMVVSARAKHVETFLAGVSWERERAKALVSQIAAYCGNPDAAEGCRLILNAIRAYEKGAE